MLSVKLTHAALFNLVMVIYEANLTRSTASYVRADKDWLTQMKLMNARQGTTFKIKQKLQQSRQSAGRIGQQNNLQHEELISNTS